MFTLWNCVIYTFGLLVTLYCALRLFRFVLWYSKLRRMTRIVNKLPGDKTHPIYGNLHQHPGPSAASLLWNIDMARKYGNILRFWGGPFHPVVMLNHPDTAKVLLKTAEPKDVSGAGVYALVRPWLGDGLLLSYGKKWQRNRRLLTPAFHFDVLRSYTEVYNDAADILLTKWAKQLVATPSDSVEVFGAVSLCTVDIILRCAFSYEADVQRIPNLYVKAVMSIATLVSERIFKILWHFDLIYYRTARGKMFEKACDYVHMFADHIVRRRREALVAKPDEAQKRYRDFLDILLLAKDEDGKGLTDIEIRDEVDTFLFEGHDTTASAISWCLYNFAKHPDIQQRVREEVDSVLAGRDKPFITCDDLSGLPYLTMCIKESMRLCPPVPFIDRELIEPLAVGGVTLPEGMIVAVPIWTIHHNELVWGQDHMEYKPERFDPENTKKMDPYAFIPFSAGPRNCIGQVFAMHELKVVIARVLHRYTLEVDTTHKVEMVPEITLRAKDGIKLHLLPRK